MGLMDWDDDEILAYGNKQASLINPNFPGDTDPLPLPGLQDKIGSKLFGSAAEQSGLNPRQSRAARQNAVMAMAASLLQSSGGRGRQRVPFGAALGHALMAGQQGHLQGIEQQSAMEQMGIKKKAELDRKAIFMRFPPPPDGATPDQIQGWVTQIVPHLLTAGLVDDASKLSEAAKRLGDNFNLQAVYAGDKIYTFNPRTGKYTEGPERGMTNDAKELARLKLEEQRARTRAMLGVANERSNRLQTNAFLTRNKDIVQRMPVITQALLTLEQAKTDETLTSSAIINFMQAADQKAQIRWQLLNWFKANVKQSLSGRWDMAVARNFKGKLPPDVMAAMEEHLLRLRKLNTDDYTRRRAGEIKRHPDLDGWLPPPDELDDPEAWHHKMDVSDLDSELDRMGLGRGATE